MIFSHFVSLQMSYDFRRLIHPFVVHDNNAQKMINIRHLLNNMKLESSQFIDYPKRTDLLFA
jgi:hypothetical protein